MTDYFTQFAQSRQTGGQTGANTRTNNKTYSTNNAYPTYQQQPQWAYTDPNAIYNANPYGISGEQIVGEIETIGYQYQLQQAGQTTGQPGTGQPSNGQTPSNGSSSLVKQATDWAFKEYKKEDHGLFGQLSKSDGKNLLKTSTTETAKDAAINTGTKTAADATVKSAGTQTLENTATKAVTQTAAKSSWYNTTWLGGSAGTGLAAKGGTAQSLGISLGANALGSVVRTALWGSEKKQSKTGKWISIAGTVISVLPLPYAQAVGGVLSFAGQLL